MQEINCQVGKMSSSSSSFKIFCDISLIINYNRLIYEVFGRLSDEIPIEIM